MKRVSISIAIFLFIAWVAALLLNIDLYRKTNIELHVFGPITDAVFFMVIGLGLFVVVALNSKGADHPKRWVNGVLLVLGICTIFLISFFYTITF